MSNILKGAAALSLALVVSACGNNAPEEEYVVVEPEPEPISVEPEYTGKYK